MRKVAREAAGEMTVGELMAWYVETCSRPHKKTWKRDEDNIRRHLPPVASWPISRLTRQELRAIHAKIGETSGHSSANHVLALVRTVFNRATENEKWDGANPAVGIKPFREKSRDRRLMPGEIPAFFDAVMRQPNAEFRDFILLALFTGARKSNVLAMRWDQIDLVGRTWRIPETKNGTPQTIPLGDPEIEILTARKAGAKSPWVLPSDASKTGHLPCGWRRWKNLVKDAGLPPCDLRIHDLRRTLGSWMVDTGATLAVIGQALHHKSPSATAIYARLSLDPVREAKGKAIDALLKARSNDVAP